MRILKLLSSAAVLISNSELVSGQWDREASLYYENRDTGHHFYESEELYADFDPESGNYKEYRYDRRYGRDYYWKLYDDGFYSERKFEARYHEVTYFTDKDDELVYWVTHFGLFCGVSAGICCLIALAVILTQGIGKVRKRKREQ